MQLIVSYAFLCICQFFTTRQRRLSVILFAGGSYVIITNNASELTPSLSPASFCAGILPALAPTPPTPLYRDPSSPARPPRHAQTC